MATGANKTRLYNKKILPFVAMKDEFLDYLDTLMRDVGKNEFRNDGVFDTAIVVEFAGFDNQIDVARLASFRATDGEGFTLVGDVGESILQNVPVPPDAGVDYHVALESAVVESDVETNPRTGEFEYSKFTEVIGRLGTPDSVVDVGGGVIELNINGLTEVGKDYSGRSAIVFLTARTEGGPGALSPSQSVAFETRTVSFSAGNNLLTTVGNFGQSTVSTTASDYRVLIIGPTIKRLALEDLRTTAGAVFLAKVTSVAAGNPIAAFDTTEQNVIVFSISDFDEVVRRDSHGDMKISVTADPSDTDENQIEVLNAPGGSVMFSVDEDGDVVILGDLLVAGTETITTNQTVLGDVQIGDDADIDSLTVLADTLMSADFTMATKPGGLEGRKIIWGGLVGEPEWVSRWETVNLANDHLVIGRDDSEAGDAFVAFKQFGSGGATGIEVEGPIRAGTGTSGDPQGLIQLVSDASADERMDMSIDDATQTVTFGMMDAGGAWTLVVEDLGGGGDTTFECKIIDVDNIIGGDAAGLTIDDIFTNSPVQFSETGTIGDALTTGYKSIIGGMNEHSNVLAQNIPPSLLSGNLLVTDGGGLDADFSTGVAIALGRSYDVASGSVAVADNNNSIVYVDGADGVVKSTTGTAYKSEAVRGFVMAKVNTSGGSITSIIDLRRHARGNVLRSEVTVGLRGDFTDLNSALEYADKWNVEAGTDDKLDVRVLGGPFIVNATVTISNPITIRMSSNALIEWTFNGPLFTLTTGANNVRLIGINAHYDNTGTQSSSSFLNVPGGQTAVDLRIEGCRVTSESGEDNINNVVDIDGTCLSMVIYDNEFNDTAGHAIFLGTGADGALIQRNLMFSSEGEAIEIDADRVIVMGNRFEGHVRGIDVDGTDCIVSGNIGFNIDGYALSFAADGNVAIGNIFKDCNDTSTTGGVIVVDGNNLIIANNVVNNWDFGWAIAGDGNQVIITGNSCITAKGTGADSDILGGIELDGTGDYGIIGFNWIELAKGASSGSGAKSAIGISSNGATTDYLFIIGNAVRNCGRSADNGSGIDVGSNSIVMGNFIRNVRGHGIDLPEDRITVIGNYLNDIKNGQGIHTGASQDWGVITGNTILMRDPATYSAIRLQGDNTYCQGNCLSGTGDLALLDDGTGNSTTGGGNITGMV